MVALTDIKEILLEKARHHALERGWTGELVPCSNKPSWDDCITINPGMVMLYFNAGKDTLAVTLEL